MANENLFNEINSTVGVIKNLAKNSKDKDYSLEEIKQFLTIKQWRHIVVLMKILRFSESVLNTGHIIKFSKGFCNKILNYYEIDNSSRLVQCFNIVLQHADKITLPMVHLAEILLLTCGRNIDNYNTILSKTGINKHFYDNYEQCDGDFSNIISRSHVDFPRLLIGKYFNTPNGLVMLDNALIVTTIVNGDCGKFKANNKIIDTIQKRLIDYAMSKNANVYHIVKQYSDLYNLIAENIVYKTSDGLAARTREMTMTLLEQTVVNRVIDFSDPIHETIFHYPKDMQLATIYSAGFGTKSNIVEQISNIIDKNATILKKYYKTSSETHPIFLDFGKYLGNIGENDSYMMSEGKIIAINKGNQLEAATKYLLLVELDEKLNQLFDEPTAAKIFVTSTKRLETLVNNYYITMLGINLDDGDIDGENFYDGEIDWNMVENKAKTYVQKLLSIFEQVCTPKCTITSYPPIVRIAIDYYYEQIMEDFERLENRIIGSFDDNYAKTMFGNVTVETFEQELKKIVGQLITSANNNVNNIADSTNKVTKEIEYRNMCKYYNGFDYIVKTIKELE